LEPRILIVDDDEQVLGLFAKVLTRGGYSVSIEPSGQKALERLNTEGPFDLLVLDLCMPQPDGFEVLKEVRSRYAGLRTLVISGYMGGALLVASELLGATATLNKKDAVEHLLPQVDLLLQRSQLVG
jgi:two-component system OmpR family response regulator